MKLTSEIIKKLPKAELHCHLDGSLRIDTILNLALEQGIKLPSDNKKILKDLNFNISFGQHSGVIDSTKNFLELPRFPINEKYGNLDRFKFILNLLPFPHKKIYPENRYLQKSENPPELRIVFFENQKNLRNINCFSNEGNRWRDSKIKLGEENIQTINIEEKFTTERGRINCSLNDKNGWRWLGIQYVISEY